VGITANQNKCKEHIDSSTATITALIPVLGYETACRVVKQVRQTGEGLRNVIISEGLLTAEQFEELTSPEAVCRLGSENSQQADQTDIRADKG